MSEHEESTLDVASEAAEDDEALPFEPPESETDPDTGDPDYPVQGA